MSRKTRPFSSRILFTAIAALLTASRGGASTASAIYSAVLNASDNQVTIAGDNFSPSGLAPTVVFGRAALALVSFTNRKLVATPPAGLSAGSYSLTVTNSVPQSGAFSVSIGALGPAGPGPTGPADPQEPQRALGTHGTAAILSGCCNFSRPLREGRPNPPAGVFFLLGQLGVLGGGPYCFDGIDPSSPNNESFLFPWPPDTIRRFVAESDARGVSVAARVADGCASLVPINDVSVGQTIVLCRLPALPSVADHEVRWSAPPK